jgi:hypothetical protein
MSRSPEVHAFGHSSGGGAKSRVVGTDDWTATLEQNCYGAAPTVTPGQIFTLKITEGTGVNANVFQGACVVIDVSTDYDVDTGAPVKRTYELGGNGAATTDLTGGTGSAAFSAKNAVFEWEAIA